MADDWRRIAATLADPVRRRVYASIVLNVPIDLPPKKRDKALAALVAAGLVHAERDAYVVTDDAFTALLASSPSVSRTGVDRFVRDGRIVQFPVRADDRLELLTWARDRAFPDSVRLSERDLAFPDSARLSERDLGARLANLTSDVAALRRYLVDAGLVVRDADGRQYWRAS